KRPILCGPDLSHPECLSEHRPTRTTRPRVGLKGIMTARDAKCAVESTWRKVARAHRAGLPPWRQALQFQLRHPAAHEVGDDAGGAAGHGPAHVPVAAIEEEIAMAAEPKDGWPIGRHRPQARAVLSPIVVDGVGKDVPCEAKDVVEVTR